ncbi:MAG: radical SAM protein [Candidatus Margulisbacteria bacterium]|nr:radical SAM protein [Candidatus Margulisiibacteriota bacterium]
MLKICHYYVTLRCNDTCEFCDLWRGSEDRENRESGDLGMLESIRRLGIKHLNITGGEPLLREDLPEILQRARGLGFFISLTTNGILYPEKARLISGLVDRIYFSVDYPIAEEHNRSRGEDCFHQVIQAIKLARELGEKPVIFYTITRDSVRFLPEMIDLAEKLRVSIYLNPVYDNFGTQGFAAETLAYIKYFFRRKSVILNLTALEFIKAGGNRVLYPRCRAKQTTITVMPDGSRAEPCFFNPGGQQGKEPVCSSCMRWPYMLPSLASGIDKYFWLNLFSEGVNQYKRRKNS